MADYVRNKKATFDYELLERFEAGLVLFGFEVKAIRAGKVSIQGAYVIVRGGEAFLVGATVSPFQEKNAPPDFDRERPRKLLFSRKELRELETVDKEKGLTLVPIRLYNSGRNIKLEVGVGRGKKKYDKRESLKARASQRDVERTLKYR